MADKNFTIKEGVNVAEEVFAIVAGLAATEVEGVESLAGNLTGEMIPKTPSSRLSRAVRVTSDEEDALNVKVSLQLAYGYEIPSVSAQVQDKVKSTVESMTGMKVSKVDVKIAGVTMNN